MLTKKEIDIKLDRNLRIYQAFSKKFSGSDTPYEAGLHVLFNQAADQIKNRKELPFKSLIGNIVDLSSVSKADTVISLLRSIKIFDRFLDLDQSTDPEKLKKSIPYQDIQLPDQEQQKEDVYLSKKRAELKLTQIGETALKASDLKQAFPIGQLRRTYFYDSLERVQIYKGKKAPVLFVPPPHR